MAHSSIEEVVRAIAEETQASLETVAQLYSDVLAHFEEDARIRDYIPLFAAKRVREQLKGTSHSQSEMADPILVNDSVRISTPSVNCLPPHDSHTQSLSMAGHTTGTSLQNA